MENADHLSLVELRLARFRCGVLPEDVDGPPLGVLIGEQPNERGHGRATARVNLALFPSPQTSAAVRLMRMADMTPAQWLGRFHRRNLFDEYEPTWSRERARVRAGLLTVMLAALGPSFRVVLLGERVARAFDVKMFETVGNLAAVPHPSGRNRAYNDKANRDRTGAIVRWAARLPSA